MPLSSVFTSVKLRAMTSPPPPPIKSQIVEDTPETSRKAASFMTSDGTKQVLLDPEGNADNKKRVGTSLDAK